MRFEDRVENVDVKTEVVIMLDSLMIKNELKFTEST
jgi:hypothetical protein